MTKQVTRDSLSLSLSPLEPFPSPSIPFLPAATSHASLSHLCLHASSSSRCIPELLNDAGISRGWQRLSSFKPFNPEPFGRRGMSVVGFKKKKMEEIFFQTEKLNQSNPSIFPRVESESKLLIKNRRIEGEERVRKELREV